VLVDNVGSVQLHGIVTCTGMCDVPTGMCDIPNGMCDVLTV